VVDPRIRRLERAWEQEPGDQHALQALIAARQRAGLPFGWLRHWQVFPAERFESEFTFSVGVVEPGSWEVRTVGTTPTGEGAGLVQALRAETATGRIGVRLDLPKEEQAFQRLRHETGLSMLLLTGELSLAQLAQLDALPLTWLSFQPGSTSAADLAHLADMPLACLALRETAWSDVDLSGFPELEHLTALYLQSIKVGGHGLRYVSQSVPRLRTLSLARSSGLRTVEFLRGFTELWELDLSWCPALRADSLEPLSQLTRLRSLRLAGLHRTAMEAIAGLSDLRDLHLGRIPLLEEDFERLSRFEQLERLEVDITIAVTDIGLRHLTRLTSLRELRLKFPDAPGLSREGVLALAELPQLRVVSFEPIHEHGDPTPSWEGRWVGGFRELVDVLTSRSC